MFQQFRPIFFDAVRLKKLWVFFIAAVIFCPSSIQAEPVEPSEVDFVFMDGSFEHRERADKSTVQLMPLYSFEDFGVDDSAECGGSGNSPVNSIIPVSHIPTERDSENGCRYCPKILNDKGCDAVHIFFFVGYFAAMYFLYTQQVILQVCIPPSHTRAVPLRSEVTVQKR